MFLRAFDVGDVDCDIPDLFRRSRRSPSVPIGIASSLVVNTVVSVACCCVESVSHSVSETDLLFGFSITLKLTN